MSVSGNVNLHFAGALLAYLARGRLRFPGGHRPTAGHVVPTAFAGVGIAAAVDPAIDDWLIARLCETGIRHVRLDFSYGDGDRPAARLLERLLASSFHVTLHLVQPVDRARQMAASAEARKEWHGFVTATLDRFGSRIEILEIGSTVNRKRWTGYTLAGFLAAWEIAWREARSRRLTLAGPSVTDFEPPWNVGLLALLRERDQLPDLHTDNLFSERCTEPERYDHKILGYRLAPLHRFNLVKKARLLARIGADFGVPRLFSPAAFWTLPRIERLLPDSEEKQADYLARYLLLCAASGALERAWWGPLVCHREGLIDEGNFAYPELERITHYTSVRGGLTDLRVRPALQALGTFRELIAGSRYGGRQNAGDGLEVHAFHTATSLIHAVWTINGKAAAMADIYADSDLNAARFRGRDGEVPADRPTLASESPLYLVWPADRSIVVKPKAALLADVAIHRHLPGLTHFFFEENGWRGIVLARDATEAALLLSRIHPERIEGPTDAAVLRHARNAIWTIANPRSEGARLVVKQPVKMHLHKKLLDRFKPSKGLRSWNGTAELLRRGVGAAPPVAWFEKIGDTSLTQNYYLCEFFPAEFSARELMGAFAAGKQEFAGVDEETAYRQLADYLLRMHGRGILFRDLSGGNILIRRDDDGRLEFSLIDTGRVRVFRGPLPLRARFADLVRICNKQHPEGRRKFLGIYLAALRKAPRWWHGWPFFLYDLKVAAKRRIGRKAWKRWFAKAR